MSNKQSRKGKKGSKGNNKPQDNPITREEEEPQQPVLQQPATQEENTQHQPQEKPETQETRPEEPKVEIQTNKPPPEEQTPSHTLASESIEVSATSELAQSSQSEPQVGTVQQSVTSSEAVAETREEQAVIVEAAQIVQQQVQAKVEQSIPAIQQQQQKHNAPTHTTEFEVLSEPIEAVIQPFQREEESIEPTEVKQEASKPEAELVVQNQPQQELPKEKERNQQQRAEVAQQQHEVVAQQPVAVQPEPKIEAPVEIVPEPVEQPVAVQANRPQAQPQAEQHQAMVHEEVVTTVVEVKSPSEPEVEIQRESEVPQQPEAVEAPQAQQEVEQPQPESKPAPVEPVVQIQEVKYEETVINMNQPIDEVFFPKEEPKAPVQQPKEEERLFRLVESQQITEVVVAESIEIPKVQQEAKIVVGDSLSFSDLNYSIEVGASQEQAEPSQKSSEQPLDPIQESNSALVEQTQEQESSVEQLVVSQPEPIKIEESSPNESILASQPVEILEEKVEEKVEEVVEMKEETKEAETRIEEIVEKHEEKEEKQQESEFVRAEPPVVQEEKQEIHIEEPRQAEAQVAPSSENLGIDSNIAQPVPEREVVMIESVVEQFQREEVDRPHEAPVPAPKVVGLFLGEDPKQAKQQEKPKPSLLKKLLLPSAVGVAAGSALWLLRGKETGSSIAVGLAASALTYLCS